MIYKHRGCCGVVNLQPTRGRYGCTSWCSSPGRSITHIFVMVGGIGKQVTRKVTCDATRSGRSKKLLRYKCRIDRSGWARISQTRSQCPWMGNCGGVVVAEASQVAGGIKIPRPLTCRTYLRNSRGCHFWTHENKPRAFWIRCIQPRACAIRQIYVFEIGSSVGSGIDVARVPVRGSGPSSVALAILY